MDYLKEIKVLIVEDEPDNLGFMSECVYPSGCTVDVAIDGEVALQKLESGSFSIVITDIFMPKLDGIQLLKHIKEHHPHIEVIVVTGFSDQHSPEELRDNGAFASLAKPFSPDELSSVLKQAIQKQQRDGLSAV